MKKAFRIVSLVLAVALTAVIFCSCQELDEAKANRAIYTNKDHSEIEFRGQKYRIIIPDKYSFIVSDGDYYRVTEEDVPVLLSDWYGVPFSINNNKTVMKVSGGTAAIDGDNNTIQTIDDLNTIARDIVTYYVREDKYDAVKASLSSASLDHYYFYSYAENTPAELQIMIDDKLTQAINKAYKTPEKDKVSYHIFEKEHDGAMVMELNVCDSELILTDPQTTCYLINDGDKSWFWDGKKRGEKCFVPLSGGDAKLVKELFLQYPDSKAAYYFDLNDFDQNVIESGE